MTDTGQIPGEGLPENAGMVEQPGIPAPGAYTYLDPSGNGSEEDDLLLMPGAQGAWSDPQPMQSVQPAQPVQAMQSVSSVQSVQPVQSGQSALSGQQGPVAQGPAAHGSLGSMGSVGAVGSVGQAPVAVPPPAPTDQISRISQTSAPEHFVSEHHGAESFVSEAHAEASVAVQKPAGPEFAAPEYAAAEFAAPAPVVPEFQEERPVSEPVAEQAPVAEAVAEAVTPAPPVFDTHESGAHEAGGRDSGSVDLNGVRIPPTSATPTPPPARRPLHMGPPLPDTSGGVVRSLADRGPAGARPPVMAVANPGPPTAGPEYLDTPHEGAAAVLPGPQLGEIPPQGGTPWDPQPPQFHTPPPAPAVPVVPESAPVTAVPPVVAEAPTVASEPEPQAHAEAEPEPEQPSSGQFVRVDGSLPTTPHLAPTPVPAVVQAEPEPVPEPVAEAEVAAVITEPEAEPQPVPAPQPGPEPEPGAQAGPILVPAPRDGSPELLDEAVPEAVSEPAAVPVAESAAVAGPSAAAEEVVVAEEPAPVPEPEPEPVPVPEPVAAGRAAAPGYDDAEREAVLRVMRERRDIRNGFRSDPIPHEVLLRVLEAAHTAPSVGHSQPWDFVVIRSAETRRTMHELAQRQREAYAKSLPKGRAKQFKELKIEAILDTPVNIVVTADPTRGGRHTLGRHTQPQMAPYSSALAVENLWLAARAEGLGVGWVSFFDEREMVRALGLPEHLEVVAYLCVGYVDEFPEEPELMQAGWSKRRPLSWVVHEETYGRRALPGEEPHDLLQETVSNIRPLDAKALGEAWERQKRMTKPAGALGMLEIISAQLSGLSRMCPPPIPEPAAVAIFAGDHGVHAQGVTAWPQEVTAQMVANFLGGGAVCNAFANQVGAEVCVIDVGVAGDLPATPGLLPRKVRPGTADFTTGPALSREDVLSAVEVGIETARDLVAAGNKALLTGEMGIANTTVSAALIAVYTGIDPSEITGRGTGINDEMHARKVDVVRRALELHAPDPADPIGVLSAVGGLEHAALVGFILGGASLRTPVVLDGVSAGAAALVARAIAPEALAACIAGHRSAEPGHVAALNKLGLRPLVDLDLRLGEGTGALLALPVVQSAARAMHEVATFDSAGVTEK
ncbi:nicotinate-nucleotide-dimethylbenzimidazole phosphoribosyltransferase /cob(II)yrinic acid a,c-diamide reductase [Streptomyces sp. SLBN-118]|uniref:nicotinate-nucleotide--dimethylbenzimidazole phosphoribosyltransferase n=1 Tax=Streptomyces sp. SLBN-118 TaxID=2768454 RepID=UPI001151C883|nr:nicotinate-nucleotide--dimethylbenzimidazole phosphoribosyltransferase [Streptomyces sp. SLBN-118]TQK43386.1 nicotinate-nucleotide-dimethylbenzimidazole phosphoribosyltransferase /cob(II)yrinic acid a,c-diamide reductase [Streptomyces sp. SLBN-118]